ncbi:MAG: PotD/PotF family extracellular solute-binding protein [Lautropia sp.]
MTTSSDRKPGRRRFLSGTVGAGLGSAALGAVPRIAAAKATELRILFPGGTWKDWFDQTFVTPFAQKHGVKPIWKLGLGYEPLLIAQRARPQWDIGQLDQNTSSQQAALNSVVEWKESRIPNLKQIHPSFRYSHLAGLVHTPYGIAVNTKRITKPITSWFDLWDPAFAGKVAFPDWVWSGEQVFHAINLMVGGDSENIDPGIEKMKALYKTSKAQTINNVEHTKQLLVSEEVWICPYFGARTEQAKAAGAPVEFVLPKEGGMSWIYNTAIIANRPAESIELAEAFANDTLDPEKQIAFSRLCGYPPTNMEAMRNLPPDLKRLEFSASDLETLGKLGRRFDYMAQFAFRDRNRERWNKEVLGG